MYFCFERLFRQINIVALLMLQQCKLINVQMNNEMKMDKLRWHFVVFLQLFLHSFLLQFQCLFYYFFQFHKNQFHK